MTWMAGSAYILALVTILVLLVEFTIRLTIGARIVLFPRNHAAAKYGNFTIRKIVPKLTFWHQSVDGRWQFRTNNKGFRDDIDYEYEKASGVYRIIVLGDSHAEGFEVAQEDTFSECLGRNLKLLGLDVEVLNTGISGFGTADELVYLENEGFNYRPDMVIVAFYANDYSDNVRSNLYRLRDNELVQTSSVYAPGVQEIALTHRIPGLKWLGENSYLYSLAFNGVWFLAKSRSQQKAKLEFAVPVGEESPGQVNLAAALLNRIGELCRARGAASVLVDIPRKVGALGYATSFKRDLLARTRENFSYVLESRACLSGRNPEAPTHAPHGHHHISSETHQRLASALTQFVVDDITRHRREDFPKATRSLAALSRLAAA